MPLSHPRGLAFAPLLRNRVCLRAIAITVSGKPSASAQGSTQAIAQKLHPLGKPSRLCLGREVYHRNHARLVVPSSDEQYWIVDFISEMLVVLLFQA